MIFLDFGYMQLFFMVLKNYATFYRFWIYQFLGIFERKEMIGEDGIGRKR